MPGIPVSIEALRSSVELLLGRIEADHGSTIEIDRDFFWSIPDAALYDVYSQPTSFTIGQVSESVESINMMLEHPEFATTRGLVWVSDVLRALGAAPPTSTS